VKIYTKTGDDGTTGLQGGRRVAKSDFRIQAYGAIDEVNSCIGVILTESLDEDVASLLKRIQNELFVAGSDLSSPDLTISKTRVTPKMVEDLESAIDKYEEELAPLANFILPGGHKTAAFLHLARTIARRAETMIAALSRHEQINHDCQKYVNRLSDLLFVMARLVNKRRGVKDIIWMP